jgi:hypothetical protein
MIATLRLLIPIFAFFLVSLTMAEISSTPVNYGVVVFPGFQALGKQPIK